MRNISEFPVRVKFPVAWGEMDSFDHVNNIIYFRYFENARMRYFDEVGFLNLKEKTGLAPVLAEANCRYFQSLTYPDNLTVGARVKAIGKTSFIMEYIILSEKAGIAAIGEGVLVMYDFKASQKVVLPQTIIQAMQKLENIPEA